MEPKTSLRGRWMPGTPDLSTRYLENERSNGERRGVRDSERRTSVGRRRPVHTHKSSSSLLCEILNQIKISYVVLWGCMS